MNGLPDEPISPNDSKGDSHISFQYIGTFLKPYHTEVHWRDTMNYAAAIGYAWFGNTTAGVRYQQRQFGR